MELLKLYIWILKITFLSFGGAYSIWVLVIGEAGHECLHGKPLTSLQRTIPISACRNDLQKLMGISEILPGPQVNGIAMSAHYGFGIPGMLAMVLGLITPGLILVPVLLRLIRHHLTLPLVRAFFAGAGIATTAILAHFALSLLKPVWVSAGSRGALIGIYATLAAGLSLRYRLNPGLIVILGGLFGYLML